MREEFFPQRALYYRVSEMQADRQTLVLLHGLSGSSSAWFPFEGRFEPSFNIITVDLRGHGKSRRWRTYSEYDLELFAEDIELLLSHLGIGTYCLVGHSFGTLVALELLLRGGSAERLVLLAPNYGVHRTLLARLTRGPLSVLTAIFSRLPSIHWRGDRVDYSTLGYSSDWDMRRLWADVWNTGIRSYLHCLHHVYSFYRDHDWKRLSMPTLIVHGALDSFVPVAHGIELASIMPQARFKMLPNANHMLVLNNVDDVSAVIKTFVESREAT
ncbi:alpha/beta hydrolase [Candidatus Kaiserbacteria bacterium]|nr:alpha/beta hydrolase [Candidatus Kaiserbacteria bacterium]